MRIWDIPCRLLCDKHLLGEHRELHAIWSILTNNKKGYSDHPETKRWEGKLPALLERHRQQVLEMTIREFNHKSSLKVQSGLDYQDEMINTIEEQRELLNSKPCNCLIG